MEIFDLIDEADRVIGQATRDECHANPDFIHHVVHFTLVDRIHHLFLITQRSFAQKTDPGKWCFLGEHIIAGESYDQAVVRGATEELGFRPGKYSFEAQTIFRQPRQTEIAKFYFIDWHDEKIKFDTHEIIKIDWLTQEELIKNKNNYSQMAQYWVDHVDWSGNRVSL